MSTIYEELGIPRRYFSRSVLTEPKLKAFLWKREDGKCYYCGTPIIPFENNSIDHVIPVSRGGQDTLDNLVMCCRSCNSSKRNLTPKEFSTRGAE